MATYFHGNPSEIGGGNGLQTLILMNPAYVGYSHNDQPPQNTSNFVHLNTNSPANNHQHHHSLPHAPPSQAQHFFGIPLHGTTPSLSTASPQNAELVVPSQATCVSPKYRDYVSVSAGSPSPASGVSNGVNGVQSVLLSSKYLKSAQELLDEVVNVGRGVKSCTEKSFKRQPKIIGYTSAVAASCDRQSGRDINAKRATELTTSERQEIHMIKAKLVNMLDEVEQRYRQYHHQMQTVISWFEQAAGLGSAKTYTALALETISKQFRCLKDAILSQIKSASKSLGEEENTQGKTGRSRLRYVDNQIRQQRGLQQLGMSQHDAWRPQRGLPERSVSVLRAWLFQHFLHPYPKDSDKLMLAKQTGLTRSQVSNWFINARVRLWKPMVEEMYMEEMKEHERNASEDNESEHDELDSNSKSSFPQAKRPDTTEHHHNSKSITPKQDTNTINPIQKSPPGPTTTMRHIPGFDTVGSSSLEIDSITKNSPRKLRISDMLPNTTDDRRGTDGFTLMGPPTNFIGGFGSYAMGELGRFGPDKFHQAQYSGSKGVSLTLGLPHCDNLGAHQSFVSNLQMSEGNDFSGMNAQTNANNVYGNISIQDRKRFAAQLLPDFVA